MIAVYLWQTSAQAVCLGTMRGGAEVSLALQATVLQRPFRAVDVDCVSADQPLIDRGIGDRRGERPDPPVTNATFVPATFVPD